MFPWCAAVAALLCSLLPGPPAALLGPAPASASSALPPPPPPPMDSSAVASASTCESARFKCAYRTGCGRALQNYVMSCSTALQQQHGHGAPAHVVCPEQCQYALIALTSTDEGKDLMTCKCGDKYCEETKQRVEVCRPHVEKATLHDSVVSCRLAQLICKADALCSTAFDFYHRFCRPMFQGKRCTRRCNNSISILQRQEKAAKLISCRCDARDDECRATRSNMNRLCSPGEPNGWGADGGHNRSHAPPPAGAQPGHHHERPARPPADADAAAPAPAAAAPGPVTRADPYLVVRAAAVAAAVVAAAARVLPHAT